MWVQSMGQEDPLEEETATQFSIIAWKIPWTEEPGGLQSMGSQSQTQVSTAHTHMPLKAAMYGQQGGSWLYGSEGQGLS